MFPFIAGIGITYLGAKYLTASAGRAEQLVQQHRARQAAEARATYVSPASITADLFAVAPGAKDVPAENDYMRSDLTYENVETLLNDIAPAAFQRMFNVRLGNTRVLTPDYTDEDNYVREMDPWFGFNNGRNRVANRYAVYRTQVPYENQWYETHGIYAQ